MADYAVIVAAGKGERMGASLPKQFLNVAGLPVVLRTVQAFLRAVEGIRIVVAIPPGFGLLWQSLCAEHNIAGECLVTEGSATRFHSVLNSLSLIPEDADGLVAVHDGVRPFASPSLIRRCFDVARSEGSAVPAVPVADTLRRIEGEESVQADRHLYRLVQTPQVFCLSWLREAYAQPYDPAFTDDASAVEHAGHRLTLVEGERANIKLTTPEDLALAEFLCRR